MTERTQAETLLRRAELAEQHNWLRKAGMMYREAAQAGSVQAMYALGNLYQNKNYQGDRQPLTGMADSSARPDLQAAFDWYLRAAQAGHPGAMDRLALMLYEGSAGRSSWKEARQWWEKAADLGNGQAVRALRTKFGLDNPAWQLSDAEYDALLEQFCRAADFQHAEVTELWPRLLFGSDAQLSRLGYQLATGRYNRSGAYRMFEYPRRSNGRPIEPVAGLPSVWWIWTPLRSPSPCSASAATPTSRSIPF